MKAITLHQPYASLIAAGVKRIETRSWTAPAALIGERIAIHAGKRVVRMSEISAAERAQLTRIFGMNWRVKIPYGGIVAVATLADSRRVRVEADRPTEPLELMFGGFAIGRHMWRLDNVVEVRPCARINGRQGFWNVPIGVVLPD